MTIWYFIVEILLVGFGFLGGFFYRKYVMDSHQQSLEALGKKILDEARKEGESIRKEAKLQAKDQLLQMKTDFEKETHERRHELNQLERRLLQKEENLEKKGALVDERDNELIKKHKLAAKLEEDLKAQAERYQQLVAEQNTRLEHLAGMSAQEAKDHLLHSMEREIRADAARMVKRIETEAKEHADRKAKDIIGEAEGIVAPITTRGKTLYRARFGPYAEQDARNVCTQLTQRMNSQACLPVVAR